MDLSEVADNKNRHPWELSRTRCILKEIHALTNVENVLDIGCGDGFFDRELSKKEIRVKRIVGYDCFLDCEKTEGICSWTNSLEGIEDEAFDLILMMDVLEHIEDDVIFLTTIAKKLKPGGTILITVPAFMSLYSKHDVELRHYRRYDRHMLHKLIEGAQLKLIEESYFYCSLILLRVLTKNKTQNLSMWGHEETNIRTKIVTAVLNTDYDLIRFFSRNHIFFGGLSLLSMVRK